ncbi:hypothetical protein LINPERHAP2_LOCUS17049 [Linum perenne]
MPIASPAKTWAIHRSVPKFPNLEFSSFFFLFSLTANLRNRFDEAELENTNVSQNEDVGLSESWRTWQRLNKVIGFLNPSWSLWMTHFLICCLVGSSSSTQILRDWEGRRLAGEAIGSVDPWIAQVLAGDDSLNKFDDDNYIAKKYMQQFAVDLDWKVKLLIQTVQEDLHMNISVSKAWRIRRKAKEMVSGSERLYDYCDEVQRSNVCSTIFVETNDDGVFRPMYCSLRACKEGFLAGSNKVIGVDGCFPKTKYEGQLS